MFGVEEKHFRPIQLYQLDTSGIRFEQCAPTDTLKPYIYYYWQLHIDVDRLQLPVIPDGAIDLVFSAAKDNFAGLYFPQIEKFELALTGPAHYYGICLQITRISELFGLPIEQLRQISHGEETISMLQLGYLKRQLQTAKADEDGSHCFNQFFGDRKLRGSHGVIDHLFYELQRSLEPASVSALAKTIGLSPRQLRRLSEKETGLSPKKVQRIIRLQLLLQSLINPADNDAADSYYDDSHKIRELRALTGCTPGEIRRMAEIYNQSRC